MKNKHIFILIISQIAMNTNAQEIRDIFGKEITSVNTNSTEKKLPLNFLGKKLENSNIGLTNDKVTSIVFTINGKEYLDLLKKILETYNNPKLALEPNVFPNVKNEEKEGTFSSGKVSSKDFVFDKTKLQNYIYFIWDTETYLIHCYKPETVMNPDGEIRIEIIGK